MRITQLVRTEMTNQTEPNLLSRTMQRDPRNPQQAAWPSGQRVWRDARSHRFSWVRAVGRNPFQTPSQLLGGFKHPRSWEQKPCTDALGFFPCFLSRHEGNFQRKLDRHYVAWKQINIKHTGELSFYSHSKLSWTLLSRNLNCTKHSSQERWYL